MWAFQGLQSLWTSCDFVLDVGQTHYLACAGDLDFKCRSYDHISSWLAKITVTAENSKHHLNGRYWLKR